MGSFQLAINFPKDLNETTVYQLQEVEFYVFPGVTSRNGL